MNSKQLQGGRKTLESLGLREGGQIIAVLYQSAQVENGPEEGRDHPGDSFAQNEEYFEVEFCIAGQKTYRMNAKRRCYFEF